MYSAKLDILIEQLKNDGNDTEIVRRDVLSDLDQTYSSSHRSWRWKKWIFVTIVWLVNLGLALTIMFTRWGIYLAYPFITLPKVRDVIYILSTLGAITFKRYKGMWGKKNTESLENTQCTIASLVTCYSEDFKSVKDNISRLMSVTKSKQGVNITNLVICVCDGMAIGKGNEKPLCDMFHEIMDVTQPEIIRYYETWKGDLCKATLYYGFINENDDESNEDIVFDEHNTNRILLIKKNKNHGKKDGLLLAKGIINDINKGKIVLEGLELPIKYVYSTDADTVTHESSLERGIEYMEMYPEVDAGVFILRVKFQRDRCCNWFWDHFQSFQYFSSQYVRRAAESVFGKVTCLSGSGNICRVSSGAYHYANKRYAEYPRTTSLMDVTPKMIGTDRRYTSLKLKYSRDVKLVMFPDCIVETETPQNIKTYISQRKRWGTNTLSNSLVNIASKNIPWYTKLSGIVDIFRLIASYFRFTSFVYFWIFLFLGKVNLTILIIVGSTVGFIYLYTFLAIIIVGDKRLSLIYGFITNKLLTPLLTVRIFTEILLNFDDFTWGSTQKTKGQLGEDIDLELGLRQYRNTTSTTPTTPTTLTTPIEKYNNLENVEETEDGVLFIGPPENKKKRLQKQKKTKFNVIDKDTNPPPPPHPPHPPTKKKKVKGNKYDNDDNDDNDDNINDNKQQTHHTKSIIDEKDLPKSLAELDNMEKYDNDGSTSEVEAKYSKSWKEQHFPSEDTGGIENDNTNNTPTTHTTTTPSLNPVHEDANIRMHLNNVLNYTPQDVEYIMDVPSPTIPPPPPPPPPPSGFNTNAKQKTRKIHWKQLDPEIAQKSFWRLSNSALHELKDLYTPNEFKELFTIHTNSNAPKVKKEIPNKIIVSAKRANNASIILNKIRRRFNTDEQCLDVVFNAIVYLNSQQISTDQLQSFITLFPLTDTEIYNLNKFLESSEQNFKNLILADKFFLKTLNIPRISERLQCELIKRTITRDIEHFKKSCIVVQNVCVELKESSKFRKFMAQVLKLGKILNNDDFSVGFKLESLLLLKETKTTVTVNLKPEQHNPKVQIKTLLDVIIKNVKENDHELLLFVQDMPSLSSINEISFNTLNTNQESITQRLTFMNQQVKYALSVVKKKEKTQEKRLARIFLKNYYNFSKKYNKQAKQYKTLITDTQDIVKDTMLYYGEKYPDVSPEQFFSVITQFIEDVKNNKLFPQ